MKINPSNLPVLLSKDKLPSKSKKRIPDPDQATATSSKRILKTQTGILLCLTNQVVDFPFHFYTRKKKLFRYINVRMKIRQLQAIFLIRYSMRHRVQSLFHLIGRSSLEAKIIKAQHLILQASLLPPAVELAKAANKQTEKAQAESSMTKKRRQNRLLRNQGQEVSSNQ